MKDYIIVENIKGALAVTLYINGIEKKYKYNEIIDDDEIMRKYRVEDAVSFYNAVIKDGLGDEKIALTGGIKFFIREMRNEKGEITEYELLDAETLQ